MKDSFYTLIFAAVLGAVCALLLTAAADFTAPYKAANEKADEIFNILTVLRVPIQAEISSEQILKIYNQNIRQKTRNGLTIYQYAPPQAKGEVQAVAVRFSGPGLWGPVKGLLALESDMRTIQGISFYQQEETPGLGGEIASTSFTERFVGKSITDKNGKAGIIIKTGAGKLLPNGVDAITGATMTCDKVQEMLNKTIKAIIEGQK
ncbi:FMN-binding protein [Planctomycetota bacterium]